MTKSQFNAILQGGFTDGCEIITSESVVSDGEESSLDGSYSFLSLEDALLFFSSNYDEEMLRAGHNTRILSITEFRKPQQ